MPYGRRLSGEEPGPGLAPACPLWGIRFVALYGQTFGHPPPLEPIALTIMGVNSAAALAVTAETSFLLSFGSQAKPHKVSAVVVPGWDGEILLGWHTLKSLGITFALDGEGIPVRVRFTRLGVECELAGRCSDEVVRETRTMVQTVVAQMGKRQGFLLSGSPSGKTQGPGEEKLGPIGGHPAEQKAGKEQSNPGGTPPISCRSAEGKGEPDPKVREIGTQPLQSGRDRRSFWKAQQEAVAELQDTGRRDDSGPHATGHS